ncbi:MAG: YmaF family protein [Syntrophomonadaceae bacterium]|nr:YmaF family protein [Syntrophomonadaceae bacterium]MDD4549739.1 YmaF family protein [Syntrophomonadaceae bacterium]
MACGNSDCRMCYPKRKPEGPKKHRPPHHDCPPENQNSDIQTHVHEFAGTGMVAGSIPHTHRFAGVTSEEIPMGDSHVHAILVNTDFFFNHYHEVGIRTGLPIFIEGEKHVHYVEGETTTNFGHDHDFAFTTFIENPLQEEED